eukprot:gene10419-10210_t
MGKNHMKGKKAKKAAAPVDGIDVKAKKAAAPVLDSDSEDGAGTAKILNLSTTKNGDMYFRTHLKTAHMNDFNLLTVK